MEGAELRLTKTLFFERSNTILSEPSHHIVSCISNDRDLSLGLNRNSLQAAPDVLQSEKSDPQPAVIYQGAKFNFSSKINCKEEDDIQENNLDLQSILQVGTQLEDSDNGSVSDTWTALCLPEFSYDTNYGSDSAKQSQDRSVENSVKVYRLNPEPARICYQELLNSERDVCDTVICKFDKTTDVEKLSSLDVGVPPECNKFKTSINFKSYFKSVLEKGQGYFSTENTNEDITKQPSMKDQENGLEDLGDVNVQSEPLEGCDTHMAIQSFVFTNNVLQKTTTSSECASENCIVSNSDATKLDVRSNESNSAESKTTCKEEDDFQENNLDSVLQVGIQLDNSDNESVSDTWAALNLSGSSYDTNYDSDSQKIDFQDMSLEDSVKEYHLNPEPERTSYQEFPNSVSDVCDRSNYKFGKTTDDEKLPSLDVGQPPLCNNFETSIDCKSYFKSVLQEEQDNFSTKNTSENITKQLPMKEQENSHCKISSEDLIDVNIQRELLETCNKHTAVQSFVLPNNLPQMTTTSSVCSRGNYIISDSDATKLEVRSNETNSAELHEVILDGFPQIHSSTKLTNEHLKMCDSNVTTLQVQSDEFANNSSHSCSIGVPSVNKASTNVFPNKTNTTDPETVKYTKDFPSNDGFGARSIQEPGQSVNLTNCTKGIVPMKDIHLGSESKTLNEFDDSQEEIDVDFQDSHSTKSVIISCQERVDIDDPHWDRFNQKKAEPCVIKQIWKRKRCSNPEKDLTLSNYKKRRVRTHKQKKVKNKVARKRKASHSGKEHPRKIKKHYPATFLEELQAKKLRDQHDAIALVIEHDHNAKTKQLILRHKCYMGKLKGATSKVNSINTESEEINNILNKAKEDLRNTLHLRCDQLDMHKSKVLKFTELIYRNKLENIFKFKSEIQGSLDFYQSTRKNPKVNRISNREAQNLWDTQQVLDSYHYIYG